MESARARGSIATTEARGDPVGWRDLVYGAYERRVLKDLPREALPRHVAVMLDGNRRWAKARGAGTAHG